MNIEGCEAKYSGWEGGLGASGLQLYHQIYHNPLMCLHKAMRKKCSLAVIRGRSDAVTFLLA